MSIYIGKVCAKSTTNTKIHIYTLPRYMEMILKEKWSIQVLDPELLNILAQWHLLTATMPTVKSSTTFFLFLMKNCLLLVGKGSFHLQHTFQWYTVSWAPYRLGAINHCNWQNKDKILKLFLN